MYMCVYLQYMFSWPYKSYSRFSLEHLSTNLPWFCQVGQRPGGSALLLLVLGLGPADSHVARTGALRGLGLVQLTKIAGLLTSKNGGFNSWIMDKMDSNDNSQETVGFWYHQLFDGCFLSQFHSDIPSKNQAVSAKQGLKAFMSQVQMFGALVGFHPKAHANMATHMFIRSCREWLATIYFIHLFTTSLFVRRCCSGRCFESLNTMVSWSHYSNPLSGVCQTILSPRLIATPNSSGFF